MGSRYLEITYRQGKPVAAYFYLPRNPGDVSTRTVTSPTGLVTDYSADGRPLGIEILSLGALTLTSLNEVLAAAHQPPATADDIAPVLAMNRRASAQ